MTLCGAAQVAAAIARMNGLVPHSLQTDRPTYAPASRTSPRNVLRQRLTIFSSEY